MDFTNEDQSVIYAKLGSELANLPVGVLVNNVGMSVGAGPFLDVFPDGELLGDMVNCNVMSMARMTHLILPGMMRRKSGVVINIGSIASVGVTPLEAAYGATKVQSKKFHSK